MNFAIYTNILTPYRKYFFDLVYDECKKRGDGFKVFVMAETEPNRNWKYDSLKTSYTELLDCKTFSRGEVYIHYNKDLIKQIKEFMPDIVVCAGSYLMPGVWTLCAKKTEIGCRVFFWSESHAKEHKGLGGMKASVRELIRKIIYTQFDGFWYAGKLSREFIERYTSKKVDYVFMPNLVDGNVFSRALTYSESMKQEIKNKYGVQQGKKIFICPARLSPVKGILEFCALLNKCIYKNDVEVLVAGDGELKDDIQRYVDGNNLNLKLLGYKSQEEMVELYAIADVFLMPSLSDPNPLTVIEALWAGLPLLISEHCGNYPETVKEGENGYVFNYEDQNDAISKIEQMIRSPFKWSLQAKETSTLIALEHYDSEKVIRRAVDTLQEIDI